MLFLLRAFDRRLSRAGTGQYASSSLSPVHFGVNGLLADGNGFAQAHRGDGKPKEENGAKHEAEKPALTWFPALHIM